MQLERVDFYNLPFLAAPSSSLTYKSPALYHLESIDPGQLKFVFPPSLHFGFNQGSDL